MSFITQEFLQERYDYEDGKLIRKRNMRGGFAKGSALGCRCPTTEYDVTNFRVPGGSGQSRLVTVHRLIWIWHYGPIPPEGEIDHLDLDRRNNRIENLRLLTHRENNIAAKVKLQPNNTSGAVGVSWNKNANKWEAYIKIEGKKKYLGRFESKEEAIAVRKQAEIDNGYTELHNIVK